MDFPTEICMDQWRSKFSESFSLDRYWSIECSSLLVLLCMRPMYGPMNKCHFCRRAGGGFQGTPRSS